MHVDDIGMILSYRIVAKYKILPQIRNDLIFVAINGMEISILVVTIWK